MSTGEIEALLPSHTFKRIHRSFIVSMDKVQSYTADMVEVNGVSIPIGRAILIVDQHGELQGGVLSVLFPKHLHQINTGSDIAGVNHE